LRNVRNESKMALEPPTEWELALVMRSIYHVVSFSSQQYQHLLNNRDNLRIKLTTTDSPTVQLLCREYARSNLLALEGGSLFNWICWRFWCFWSSYPL
jgi:hypothetical protein